MEPSRNLLYWLVLTGLPTLIGCGGGAPVEMVPVTGSVKFDDGTIPTGEVATVYFEPAAGGNQALRKAASSPIDPQDGSFRMTTVHPGDGAIVGTYKVIFEVHKTYLGRESVVPEKYTNPDTTPFEVTVGSGGASQKDFVLTKR